jgi:hypothetical protein
VGPRAGMDDVEKRKISTLPGLKLRTISRPARRQSLYRLHCQGSTIATYRSYVTYNNNYLNSDKGAEGRCCDLFYPGTCLKGNVVRHWSSVRLHIQAGVIITTVQQCYADANCTTLCVYILLLQCYY